MIIVAPTDPHHPQATALLRASHALMESLYSAEDNHYLSIDDLCAPDISFFTAREGDSYLGTGALKNHHSYGEIKSMFVAEAARGRGVADALLRQIEDYACSLGLSLLRLETGHLLGAAHRLYARHGFVTCGPFGDYAANEASLFMEKPLHSASAAPHPAAEAAGKRIALVLANGAGADTLAATYRTLNLLRTHGFRVLNMPADSAALTQAIADLPTRRGGIDMSMADYQIDYAQMPADLRQSVETRWGKPEADPHYTPGQVDCGHFSLPFLQFGNVVIGLHPAREAAHATAPHAPDPVPRHNHLAFDVWLRHQFRADAIVYLDDLGSATSLPEAALAAITGQLAPPTGPR